MGQRVARGRCRLGKIAGLARTVELYGEAIDYDLMTRTRWTLRDWEDGRLDSRSLTRFVLGLGFDSAYYRACHPEDRNSIAWVDGSAECALIAELIDTVRASANALAYKGTGKRPPKLIPYPRPWQKDTSVQHFGRDPIPIGDFDRWYYGGEA